MSDFLKVNGNTPPEVKCVDKASPVVEESVTPKNQSKDKLPTVMAKDVMDSQESDIPIEEVKSDEVSTYKADSYKIPPESKSPAEDKLSKSTSKDDVLEISAKDDSPKTLSKSDVVETPAKADFLETPDEGDMIQTTAKEELSVSSDKCSSPKLAAEALPSVKAKSKISPILAPQHSSEKRPARLTRRSGRISDRASKASETSPKAGKVISLKSVKKSDEPVPEKKRIILKRRASSSYDDEFPETSKASDDAPPKKKYKPITWP